MKWGEIFTLGITHKSEISHEIETHQFEFEAVYLLTCCCTCLLVFLRHLSLWEQRCFLSVCSSSRMGLLGFGGLWSCHVRWQHCQVLQGWVSPWLKFLRPQLLELVAENFLSCDVLWKLNTSATLKGQNQRLRNPPRITFFPKPNVLFLSWWLGRGLALTWEFTGEFSREGKLSVISVILKQLIPTARSVLSSTIFFGTGHQK